MAERTGTTISCDHSWDCKRTEFAHTPEDARRLAGECGWTRHEDGRDFCPEHTRIRAERKKPADMVPAGVRVMGAFEAAEAAGFERREHADGGEDEAHFYCCDQEVEIDSIIGSPYRASCKACGTAIQSLLGPAFERGSVRFIDHDKVDTEAREHWVVVAEAEAAMEATS